MLSDAFEYIGQPGLRVDLVELGRADQAVDDGSALAAAIRTTKQPCLSAEGDTTQLLLHIRLPIGWTDQVAALGIR